MCNRSPISTIHKRVEQKEISPFNVIMARKLPHAAKVDRYPARLTIYKETWDHYSCHIDFWKNDKIKAAKTSWLYTAQRWYKGDFDKIDWQEPTFKIGDCVFVDHPQPATMASDKVDKMTSQWYSRLLGQTSGQYTVLSTQFRTVAIEDGSFPSKFSIDRFTVSLTLTQAASTAYETMQTMQPWHRT